MINNHKIKKFKIFEITLDLAYEIYKLSRTFPKDELYRITLQLRRAISSIGAKIAEGFNRNTTAHQIHFYYIAKGSVSESIFFLELAYKLGYISEDSAHPLIKNLVDLYVKIHNYIMVVKNKNK